MSKWILCGCGKLNEGINTLLERLLDSIMLRWEFRKGWSCASKFLIKNEINFQNSPSDGKTLKHLSSVFAPPSIQYIQCQFELKEFFLSHQHKISAEKVYDVKFLFSFSWKQNIRKFYCVFKNWENSCRAAGGRARTRIFPRGSQWWHISRVRTDKSSWR